MAAAQVAAPRAGAGLCARTVARFALGGDFDFDFGLLAVERLVQRDFHVIAQVGPAALLLPPAASAKGRTEDRFENIAQVGETRPRAGTTAAGHALLERFVAETVIGRAFLRVLQAVIGFADRLEPGFSFRVAGILVRMPAHRKLAVRRLDRRIVRAAGYFQQFVIVGFDRHGRPSTIKPAAAL